MIHAAAPHSPKPAAGLLPEAPAPLRARSDGMAGRQELAADFPYAGEHPVLQLPFSVTMGESRLEGCGLSLAAAHVRIGGPLDARWHNYRAPARLHFAFADFGLHVDAEVVIAGSRAPGEMTLQFADPLGPHLPQLRHILNSHIAGDLVTLGNLLSYSGPTKPRPAPAPAVTPLRRRLRRLVVAALSLLLVTSAATVMARRASQFTELRPVFIQPASRDMRATAAGQIAWLNPAADKGEVLFSVNANSGEVLNFVKPCDCSVQVAEGIFEGATVLPSDTILSLSETRLHPEAKGRISIEGYAKVMEGASAWLDMDDGRRLPVRVVTTAATIAAIEAGERSAPVELMPAEGAALTADDIGHSARLRLASPLLPRLFTRSNGAVQ